MNNVASRIYSGIGLCKDRGHIIIRLPKRVKLVFRLLDRLTFRNLIRSTQKV